MLSNTGQIGVGRVEVNSTARWPERLAQVATLLRAEGAAILAFQGSEVRTLFSSHPGGTIPWHGVLDEDDLRRALDAGDGFATAIPADRWDDAAGYALLAPIVAGTERGVLCALRHGFPFDAVEVTAGDAAARLLTMAFSDAQAAAQAERRPSAAPRPVDERVAPRLAPRVLVVEHHPATRLGLETLLVAAGFEVGASAGTLAEAIARLASSRCDIAIVDLGLPDGAAADAIERLRTAAPGTHILTFGDERSTEAVRSALRAGAIGHLGKDAPASRIAAAVHAAAAGLAPLDPAALDAVLGVPDPRARVIEEQVHAERPAAATAPSEPLSPRELELLRYLAEGYTNKEIARAMVLAEDTVKKGVQSVIAKLGAADRTHAVVIALRNGVIE